MKKKSKIDGKEYDKNAFYWALMYRRHIVRMTPTEDEVRRMALQNNRTWESQFGETPWHVKRFKFYFRGTVIDGFEHWWVRTKTKKPKHVKV